MKYIRIFIATLALIDAVIGYLTQDCVATSSSLFFTYSWLPREACDNLIGTGFAGGTAFEYNPWL